MCYCSGRCMSTVQLTVNNFDFYKQDAFSTHTTGQKCGFI